MPDNEEQSLEELVRLAVLDLGGLLDQALDKAVPHDHTSYVEGCFRCDLNKDELGVDP